MPLVAHSPQGSGLPDCHSFTPQNSAPVDEIILSLLGSLFTWLLTRTWRAAAATAYEIIIFKTVSGCSPRRESYAVTSNPGFQARKMHKYPAFNLAPESIARSQ